MAWLCLIVLIICVTILADMYLYYCNENEVGIFQDMNMYYGEKISKLEERIANQVANDVSLSPYCSELFKED